MSEKHLLQGDEETWNEFSLDDLREAARKGLVGNVVQWRGKRLMTAGAVPYHSVWTRDAAHCTRALLALGMDDVVRDTITMYLDRLDENGTGPKGADTMNMELRVVLASTRRCFCLSRRTEPFDEKRELQTVYEDARGSRAIDSNLLVILSSLLLGVRNEYSLIRQRVAEFKRMLKYYDAWIDPSDGLIVQPMYSDWQDSQKRKGKTMLTNLIYHYVCTMVLAAGLGNDLGVKEPKVSQLASSIKKTFLHPDTGVFRSMADNSPQVSLDANLLALLWGFVEGEEASALWTAIQQHPLWHGAVDSSTKSSTTCCSPKYEETGLPGFCTFPDYPQAGSHWQVKLACLSHYHDRMYWSWLMALAAEVSYIHGDTRQGDKIAIKLAQLAQRDGSVAEVYNHDDSFTMVQTALFESEHPFSWGCAYVLTMLQARDLL